MGGPSGGGSSSSGSSQQFPGSLSPVTATLWQLFSGQPAVGLQGGQYVPTSFAAGGGFSPQSFAALPGLLQNQPLSGTEASILGVGTTPNTTRQVFDQAGFNAAVADAARFSGGSQGGRSSKSGANSGVSAIPNAADFMRTELVPGGAAYGQQPGWADIAAQSALVGQNALLAGLPGVLESMNPDPSAQIGLARRGFERETLPQLLETINPSVQASSDYANTLANAGVDLETNIAALREGALDRVLQGAQVLPGYANALGSNLLQQGSNILSFGQAGREGIRGVGPEGDALRVLETIQALTGPALTTFGQSKSKSKSFQGGLG